MKNLYLVLLLVLASATYLSARPSPGIMIGTLTKRQDAAAPATCICPPTNVPCDARNLCPGTACEAADPPCGTGCCEQGLTCSSDANGPICMKMM